MRIIRNIKAVAKMLAGAYHLSFRNIYNIFYNCYEQICAILDHK